MAYPVSFRSEQRFSHLTVLGNLLESLKTHRDAQVPPPRDSDFIRLG